MRELYSQLGGDHDRVVAAYAAAERAGDVSRASNDHALSAEDYARRLLSDGIRKGWITGSGGREKPKGGAGHPWRLLIALFGVMCVVQEFDRLGHAGNERSAQDSVTEFAKTKALAACQRALSKDDLTLKDVYTGEDTVVQHVYAHRLHPIMVNCTVGSTGPKIDSVPIERLMGSYLPDSERETNDTVLY